MSKTVWLITGAGRGMGQTSPGLLWPLATRQWPRAATLSGSLPPSEPMTTADPFWGTPSTRVSETTPQQ